MLMCCRFGVLVLVLVLFRHGAVLHARQEIMEGQGGLEVHEGEAVCR